jgi:DNA-binding MarR family transcriptional regulator
MSEIAAALPGIDPSSAMLLMRAARLGRLVDLYRGRMANQDGGLDASSHAVLGALLLLGPPHRLSPTFLSRHVVQTSGGMARTLRRLEGDGLVTRVPDESDGRVSHVQLTEEGRRLATQSQSALLEEWQDALELRGVDVDDAMATVTRLLETLETLTGARLGRTFGV